MSPAVNELYRTRLAAAAGQAMARTRTLWLQQFDPDAALASVRLVSQATGDWIATAQDTAAAEAAAYLAALVAEASGQLVADVTPFAVPPVAGTTAAEGMTVADLAGLAPAVYAARTATGAEPQQAATAASAWLARITASEPYRAANLTVLHGAVDDARLTGRVQRITRPGACEFCALIRDRGYILAHAGFQAHAHCRCTASPEISSRVYTRAGRRRALAAMPRDLRQAAAALRLLS